MANPKEIRNQVVELEDSRDEGDENRNGNGAQRDFDTTDRSGEGPGA